MRIYKRYKHGSKRGGQTYHVKRRSNELVSFDKEKYRNKFNKKQREFVQGLLNKQSEGLLSIAEKARDDRMKAFELEEGTRKNVEKISAENQKQIARLKAHDRAIMLHNKKVREQNREDIAERRRLDDEAERKTEELIAKARKPKPITDDDIIEGELRKVFGRVFNG